MASLRQLEYFAEVADAGSLRQAAQRLGVTQPTLTVSLRALEDILGVVLFERTRNATLLTPVGRDLLPEALSLLSQWRNMVESAHLIGNHSHRPTVLVYRKHWVPTCCRAYCPHCISDFSNCACTFARKCLTCCSRAWRKDVLTL